MAQTRLPMILVLIVLGACAQIARSQTAFEVASIKLSVDSTRKPSIGPSPGGERFMARNMPLLWLISSAYDVSIRQISDLPKSFRSKSYDIQAKSAQRASQEEMMVMLRTLIEDRFKVRLRHESKELSAYVLAVAKDGPKLDENTSGADLEARNSGAGRESYRNFTMPIFANIWSSGRRPRETALRMVMNQRQILMRPPSSQPCGSNLVLNFGGKGWRWSFSSSITSRNPQGTSFL
jgi:uncharacterized protein (TIGR03435 family)